MAPQYTRGGIPQHINETAKNATIEGWNIEQATANYLWFKNVGYVFPIQLTLTAKDDATNNKAITIDAREVWEGPVEIGCFYVQGMGGDSDFEAVACRVRG